MVQSHKALPFESVKEFFKSWGMYPDKETADMIQDELNPEMILQGINRKCYEQMFDKCSNYLGRFVAREVEATDDSFYLSASTWDELQEAWEDYVAKL